MFESRLSIEDLLRPDRGPAKSASSVGFFGIRFTFIVRIDRNIKYASTAAVSSLVVQFSVLAIAIAHQRLPHTRTEIGRRSLQVLLCYYSY